MYKKILAIDDDPDILTFYSEVLEDGDFMPITADTGIEGLKKAREEKPDLVILDVMMPKKSGMMTYKALKRDPDLSSIPVIIITGITKEVDFKSLFNRASTGKIPPEAHLTKPLTADDLINAIQELLN